MRKTVATILAVGLVAGGALWSAASAHHKENPSHNHDASCVASGGGDVVSGFAEYSFVWDEFSFQGEDPLVLEGTGTVDYFDLGLASASCPELRYVTYLFQDSQGGNPVGSPFATLTASGNGQTKITWGDDIQIRDDDNAICTYSEVFDPSNNNTRLDRAPDTGCASFDPDSLPGQGYH